MPPHEQATAAQPAIPRAEAVRLVFAHLGLAFDERMGTDWGKRASCLGQGMLFFADDEPSIMKAKAICKECPVRLPCLQAALLDTRMDIVQGGLTKSERESQIRQAKRREKIRRQTAAH